MMIPIQTELERMLHLVSRRERRSNRKLKKSTARLRYILRSIQRMLLVTSRRQDLLEVPSC